MKDILSNSMFFGVLVSILAYEVGVLLKKKLKFALLNPLLISIVIIILILVGFHIAYDTHHTGFLLYYDTYDVCAQLLCYLLTPPTVCLAIPLYEQMELLKKNWKAIIGGIVAGVLTGAVCILVLCLIFRLEHDMYVTLLPKSITTAIGMGVSEELNGIVTITVAVIIITGVVGNVLADFVYKLFHVTHPVAKGVGLGTSAHAIGTAKALEMGEIEGAMGGLSIAVAGILTVIVAPIFSHII